MNVGTRVRLGWRPGTSWPEPRTLADVLREHPRPVNSEPHVHFHAHGGTQHSHAHGHPDDHAHSKRMDLPKHEGNA